MKCPKCEYLGFETGDRCKNCGYDFSLIVTIPSAPEPDLTIRTDDAETGVPELWLDRLDRSMDDVSRPKARNEHLIGVAEPASMSTPDPSLPLFNPDDPDDIPLIALPTAPRAPLAVRRTTETPRLRAVPKVAQVGTPALDFREEISDSAPEPAVDTSRDRYRTEASRPRPPVEGRRDVGARRLAAALIDHVILFAIDAGVLYFTIRLAGLEPIELRLLPIVPIAIFLSLLKLAYFTAFTAVGGQTIGKMALGIRVVAETGAMDGSCALRRALVSLVSILPLGLGFLPALFGADRRTLHDRLTGTRVIGLPSA
jgi:uncharacterized RDD family membrane protein YckC